MKIITIDFDIIMAPSIDLYNNISGSPWEERFKRHPLLKLADADYAIYHKLTQYLLYVVPKMNKNNIHFIANHQNVLNYLINTKEPIDIINIDHHHDIIYNGNLEELACDNWVAWIDKEYKLNSYLWIHNENSRFVTNKNVEKVKFDYSKKCFHDYEHETYKQYSIPDKLIICLSGEWVPPQYKPLFFVWFDICNQIHNTHYEFEDVKK